MVSGIRTNDFASPFVIAVVYAATLWGLQGEITSVLEDGENVEAGEEEPLLETVSGGRRRAGMWRALE